MKIKLSLLLPSRSVVFVVNILWFQIMIRCASTHPIPSQAVLGTQEDMACTPTVSMSLPPMEESLLQ